MKATAALVASLSLLWAAGASAASLEPVGTFDRPIFVTSHPDDPEVLFVGERDGLVVQVDEADTEVFADLTPLVSCCTSERGLLSIALAADFAASGRFYAAYTGTVAAGEAEGDIHVDAFRPGDQGEEELVRERIIDIGHSANANHNGGQLQFGPDGYLYVSVGDGGGGGDPFDAGQDLGTPLGKVLRIDPRAGETPAYAIPAGNPFAEPGDGALDEIWAYGLRNPWRFSFDRESGDLAIADVGQGAREEVDHAPSPAPGTVGGAGANYGWDCREGLLEYTGPPGGPSAACGGIGGLTDPVFDYPHEDPEDGGAFGCSITGGYVVRDASLGDLFGRYVYADFCQGQIRSLLLPAAGGPVGEDRSEGIAVANPTSFGEDSCGRLYVASNGGVVYRLVGDEPAVCGEGPGPGPDPDPEPSPQPEPQPAPVPVVPLISPPGPTLRPQPTRAIALRLRARVATRPSRRTRIVVRVTPCAGHAGRQLLLNRGGRRLAAKRLDRRCTARFHVPIAGRSTFRALLPGTELNRPARSRRIILGA
jgi:hypothetical protein